MAKKIWVGLFLVLVILTSSVYILLPDKVRIDVEKTKTTFKVYENGSWVLAGTEYTILYDGTTKMRAKERFINYTVDGSQTTIIRTAKFKENITAIDTYVFDGSTKDTELYPISHNIQILEGEGKILHYEVKDLFYTGETINDILSPQSFGHNMRVEWESGNYYSKIYKYKDKDEGKLTVRYRINSSDFSKNVRLFDPPIWEKVNKDNVFVKLIENKASLTQGEAVFEVHNPFDAQVDLSKYLNFEFYQAKGNINSFEVYMNYSESYEVPVYGTIIEYKNCTVFNNETEQNETIECNEEKRYVDYYETKYQESWKKASSVAKGTHKIKLIAHWTASTDGVAIDWIPKITFEKELYSLPEDIVLRKPEWEWWNLTFLYIRPLSNLTGDYIYINLSYPNFTNAQSDWDDLRFVDTTNTTEYGYFLQKKVDSAWAIFRIKTLGASSLYIYYGNADVSTTSNISNVYGTGLMAMYFFDETSGAVVDSSDNQNNGTNQGAERGVTGVIGNAFDFVSADTEYVVVPDDDSLDATVEFTIAMWIKLDAYRDYDLPFTKRLTTSTNYQIISRVDVVMGLTTDATNWFTDTPINTGEWAHFVAAFNVTNVKYFVNGSLNATVATGIPLAINVHDLMIGRDGETGSNYMDAMLDEGGLWNRELNSTEIGWLYNSTEPVYVLGAEEAVLVVTLNTPIDTANLTSLPVIFNCTASDLINLTNVSLYIDGVLNETNISGINADYLFTKSLSSGNHNWTCGACNNRSTCIIPTARTFTIRLNITGWVKSEEQAFVSGARVWVINQTDNITAGSVITNGTGYWTFGPVLAGNYLITGYDPANSSRDGDAAPFIVVP